MALTNIPKQRYNITHPEKNGGNFEQVVKSQKYTTFSSLDNVAAEIDGDARGKNVIHVYTENNICLIDRRYNSFYNADGNEIFEITSEKKFETAEEVFRDFCARVNLKIPNNDQKFRDNLDPESKKTNQTIAEQFMFAMDSDYAEQIGWRKGMPATPEVLEWTNDQMDFFKKHFGYQGAQNVLVAYLHLDEDAPHLQILYVPMSDYERKPIADKEPSRDKNGDIKYVLKPEFAKPRKKYITLPDSLTADERAERLSQIEQDDHGQPVMKMKQVRRTTVDKDGKTHSWVPVSHDANGFARYETRHTGKYRIGSTAMWQGFLAERKEDMRQRGIPVPEQYIDNQGRNQMKPWNALQDVYQEEVGAKWGMNRGRVGSHGKGNRPSALTEEEKRLREEARAEIAKQHADKEAQRAQEYKAKADRSELQTKAAERKSIERIRKANEVANAVERDADQRKKEAEKAERESEKQIQTAKANAEKRVAEAGRQAQEDWDCREEKRRKKRTEANNLEIATGQLKAETVRGEAQAKLDAASAYEANVQALTGAVLPETAGTSQYYLLTLNPEQDLKPVPLKKGFYQVSAEQLAQWQQEGQTLFAGAQANQELLRLLDPADLEQRFQEVYKDKATAVATVKHMAQINVDNANDRAARAEKEVKEVRGSDSGKLYKLVKDYSKACKDLTSDVDSLKHDLDESRTQLAHEDKELVQRYQQTGDLNDYDTWAATYPLETDSEQSVRLLDPETRDQIRGVLDNQAQQIERRLNTVETKVNHLEQTIQTMKELAQKADNWLGEKHPKAHALLHEAFPKLREMFGLKQPQEQHEVHFGEDLQQGAQQHDQNQSRGTPGRRRRHGGPYLS